MKATDMEYVDIKTFCPVSRLTVKIQLEVREQKGASVVRGYPMNCTHDNGICNKSPRCLLKAESITTGRFEK